MSPLMPAQQLVSLRAVPAPRAPPAAPSPRQLRPRHQRQQRRARQARYAAAGGDAAAAAGAPPPPQRSAAPELSEAEVEARLSKAAGLIGTSHLLVPYDSQAVNLALVIWQAIREVPPAARPRLLPRLSSADIRRLWAVAGRRYAAAPGAVAAALGPDYSLWADLPSEAGEVAYFSGRAALPVHALGLSAFTKAFFLAPDRGPTYVGGNGGGSAASGGGAARAAAGGDGGAAAEEEGSEEESEEEALYGRVLLHKGPLGDLLYPMYLKGTVGRGVVPGTGEPCDAVLQYLDPGELGLTRGALPRSAWPPPRRHLPPFDGQYVDYLRAAGPGVYVGVGFKTSPDAGPPAPLYFAMAQQRLETLR